MTSRVTIKDVAREADVSIKTVSNVINGTGRMRPDTRERVENAMRKLGYTVNLSARAIRSGGTRLIGLNIFDFSQPFAPYLTDKVIEFAKARQYGVIINTYGSDGMGLADNIEETYRLGADGWIFFSERALADEGAVLQQPYPVVLAGDYLTYGKSDLVTMPNVEAVKQSVGRLLDSGTRAIALLGAPPGMEDWETIKQQREGTQALRTQGYVQAFLERGLEVDWRYVIPVHRWNQHGGVQATAAMLDSLPCPEAVVCLNDAMALGAVHELQRRGLRIPNDVQLVGFDNVPEAEYSVPALTTIDPHVDDYAKHAVDMLIDRIEGYAGPARTYTTDFTLVERASTRLAL
ncbi:LacI family DNA-binding transcriptional regulator [Bifidobacterium miconisargentati]|uniref:LacI family DNA-binding transcriptional regulator n=1 Tax=Bifidobacterium miconisargentati TaxID=2834437 RepID=UPI001BDCCD3E|nr:LacI family DNA-binding transcriptional regulator [Bifidobacterium miconisargentati]MBW3089616.1 LacI family DNA-binding transcriptional regulator [Bifidobacterium miconisargentati]